MILWLKKSTGILELVTEWVGRAVAWLVLLMVVLTFVIVVLRYIFNTGWIALQESVIYAHALVFLLGAAFALKHNHHVRVDVFYQRMSPRAKAVVDLIGTVFLLIPVSLFILFSSYEYVMDAIELREGSREAGGLPFVYLLKTQIISMGGLLIIQAIAEILKNLAVLMEPTREQV
jgi:TRAP-type mannitol/chloroaromatic compound transport system permease small subunit